MKRAKLKEEPREKKVRVLFDSGAFGVWKKGGEINLDGYITFLHANKYWMDEYVALDKINPDDPERAAAQSMDQFLAMRSNGLEPIPVYHIFEDVKWLYKYIDLGCSYVGVASSSSKPGERDDFNRRIWNNLVSANGLPIVKVHAFGEGRDHSMEAFPWFSADSTSWIYACQRTGVADLPGGFKLNFRTDGKGDNHFTKLGKSDRKVIDNLTAKYGMIPIEKCHSQIMKYLWLTMITGFTWHELEERINSQLPIIYHPYSILKNNPSAMKPGLRHSEFRLFLVTGTNLGAFAVCIKAAHKHMLISYETFLSKHSRVNEAYPDFFSNLVFEPEKFDSIVLAASNFKTYHDQVRTLQELFI